MDQIDEKWLKVLKVFFSEIVSEISCPICYITLHESMTFWVCYPVFLKVFCEWDLWSYQIFPSKRPSAISIQCFESQVVFCLIDNGNLYLALEEVLKLEQREIRVNLSNLMLSNSCRALLHVCFSISSIWKINSAKFGVTEENFQR